MGVNAHPGRPRPFRFATWALIDIDIDIDIFGFIVNEYNVITIA
eukprot:COSAG02_NODE_21959_length_768_cov_1.399103_1_plen_44_part_00